MKFKKHPVKERSKLLVVADSGAGKTGLLATIANAGYKLRIIDADNGLDILSTYLTDKGEDNTSFITLEDKEDKGKVVTAWGQFVQILNNGWKDGDEDLGRLQDWDENTVLVIDTLNFLGKAALKSTLLQNKLDPDSQPQLQHWGEAARKVENAIARLVSSEFKCNVVVNTHMRGVSDDYGRMRFYPAAVGEKLALDIGGYFNTVVRIDVKSKPGKPEERVIRTESDSKMTLKTSAPVKFQVEEPFDLAKVIHKIQGK